jgi:hypothetical protein
MDNGVKNIIFYDIDLTLGCILEKALLTIIKKKPN